MEYRSNARLFGLPLLHIASGTLVDGAYRRGVATGWVAIGEIAIGVFNTAPKQLVQQHDKKES